MACGPGAWSKGSGLLVQPVNSKLAPATGTCQLPLQGLSHELLQPLTFNTP